MKYLRYTYQSSHSHLSPFDIILQQRQRPNINILHLYYIFFPSSFFPPQAHFFFGKKISVNSVFSSNEGKYGQEKTLYLETFHAVLLKFERFQWGYFFANFTLLSPKIIFLLHFLLFVQYHKKCEIQKHIKCLLYDTSNHQKLTYQLSTF